MVKIEITSVTDLVNLVDLEILTLWQAKNLFYFNDDTGRVESKLFDSSGNLLVPNLRQINTGGK
jgi:hypothetical protein